MLKIVKEYIFITFGAVLMAVGVYFFKIPYGFSTGGVSGIATVLSKIIPNLSAATLILIMNVALLVLGFIFVNKDFGVRTVYCTLMYSALTYLFELLIPAEAVSAGNPLTDQPLLELIFAILLTSFGAAIMFNTGASSGGTDIIAMILKKYTAINVGTALLIADAIVAFSSFFVFDVTIGLFSVLGLFMKAFLVDGIIENMNMCKYFTIITEKPDEICDFIMTTLHRGVTKQDAEGAFSHNKKKVLLTVCKRSEAHQLKLKVKEIDPTSFIMITNSSEILGRGFRNF